MTASPYLNIRPALSSAARPLTAAQVAKAYNFPTGNGQGRTIAIIELGGAYGSADLREYFGAQVPNVEAITLDGASESHSDADGEVLLDIEVAMSIASAATCRVYFCANSDQGFLDGITRATADLSAGDAISISWGGPESSWDSGAMDAFDKAFATALAKGVNVFVAAGDSGADDGTSYPVADFPASSPHVVSCGGTRLSVNSDGSRSSETTWNDSSTSATGGGLSRHFPGRQVPDVAGNADPNSGYEIVVDGQREVVGGTSAVAPLMAALCVVLSAQVGTFDFLKAVTANPTVCFDVTVGDNGAYRAGPGRDQVTGFGVVDGTRLLSKLTIIAPSQPAPTPTPTPSTTVQISADALRSFLSAATPWAAEPHSSHSNKLMQDATKKFIAATQAAT